MNWKPVLMLVFVLLSMGILNRSMQPVSAPHLGTLFWTPYTRLSNTATETRYSMVATNEKYDPNYIVVVFTDNLTGQFDWYFTKSTDGGGSWSTPQIAVDPDFDVMESERYCAAIAMDDNGIVHMSFARQKTFWPRDTAPTGIYYARYDGTNWSGPITIYEDLSPGYLLLYTNDIVVGMNNTVHLTYGSDYPDNDNGDIWYCRSEDGGLTWTSPTNINGFDWMDVGYHPSLAADGSGHVYYAVGGDWYSDSLWDEMYFRRSSDNGSTWDPEIVFGGSTVHDDDRDPWLMCDNSGGVYAVYAGDSYQKLKFKYSTDHGSNWTPSSGGITLAEGSGYFAELDNYGFIHIIYGSAASGVTETYYMKIDTSGNVIVPPEIITPDDGYPSYPTGLALADAQVCVTTIDTKDGNWEAYFLARALFLNPCALKVNSSPGNVDFSINGSFQRTPWKRTYEVNTTLNVEMPENYTADDSIFVWDSWSDGNSSRSRTILLDSNVTLTGNYLYTPFPPTAIFTWYPTNPFVNSTVNFDASLSEPNGGNITDYTWNFGDNDTALGVTADHVYTQPGDYTVTLNVTDSEGFSDSVAHVVSVRIAIHDVAVLSILPWRTRVVQGYTVPVEVVVANQGDLDETFSLLIYANSTLISNSGPVQLSPSASRHLGCLWDTSGVTLGTYVMSAEVTIVPGENDTADNMLADGTIAVELPTHDVAVTGVTCLPYALPGSTLQIGVTVANLGNMMETFDVVAFANGTEIGRAIVTDLDYPATCDVSLSWDTTGFSLGSYVITVTAVPVPGESEIFDNTNTDGIVTIASEGQTIVYVFPQEVHVHVNETFTMELCVFNVVDLAGWQAQVNFNHSILTDPRNPGRDYIGGGALYLPPFTGSRVLTSWTLTATAEGTSYLSISRGLTKLGDHNAQPIPYVAVDGIVLVSQHDLCLKGGNLSKTIIGKGYCADYLVKTWNNGACTEDFNVTFFANETSFGEQEVYGLNVGCSTAIRCSLNTSAFDMGNYTLSATAGPLPGELFTSDNSVVGEKFIVTIPGDVNGDFQVDIYDAIKLAGLYNMNSTSLTWNANIDINGDNIVDIYDAIILANHYNQHYP